VWRELGDEDGVGPKGGETRDGNGYPNTRWVLPDMKTGTG
jgi:hypothetical protein